MDSPPPPPPGFALPLAIRYRDDSGPFAIEATVTDWRRYSAPQEGLAVRITIGTGTLHDADKGTFPIGGTELFIRVAGSRFEPLAVLNPGVLSEFQQEGLLDLISSYLNSVSPADPGLGDQP